MNRLIWITAFVLMSLLAAMGCKSTHEQGVKSNLRKQWTDVAANTEKTTEAAKAVLEDEGLRDVSSRATNLDGEATGKMADGTKVTVAISKVTESKSQVTVNVGTLGSPSLGAELAKKIQMKAEGM